MNQKCWESFSKNRSTFSSLIILLTLSSVSESIRLPLRAVTVTNTLSSPKINNWGEWGPWAYCSEGDHVIKVAVRVELPNAIGDNTGLNAIRLLCRSRDGQKDYEIKSSEGPWGDWYGWDSCGNNTVATGFKLKSLSKRKQGDNYAATDFKLLCSNAESKYETDGSQIVPFGQWTKEQWCPSRTAICGIKTQVQASRGILGDDTALNNVEVACCRRK